MRGSRFRFHPTFHVPILNMVVVISFVEQHSFEDLSPFVTQASGIWISGSKLAGLGWDEKTSRMDWTWRLWTMISGNPHGVLLNAPDNFRTPNNIDDLARTARQIWDKKYHYEKKQKIREENLKKQNNDTSLGNRLVKTQSTCLDSR